VPGRADRRAGSKTIYSPLPDPRERARKDDGVATAPETSPKAAGRLGKPIEILLAEDNPGDVLLTQESLAESKVHNSLHVVKDGVEALAFLRNEGAFASAPRPDLILLDLNMPRKDGREVLEELKSDEDLKRIPVVILTTSDQEEDVLRAYNAHANCYLTKPIDLEQFMKVIKTIEAFWLEIVKLPI
jgi:CheY-like chemotaxis protein